MRKPSTYQATVRFKNVLVIIYKLSLITIACKNLPTHIMQYQSYLTVYCACILKYFSKFSILQLKYLKYINKILGIAYDEKKNKQSKLTF